MYVSVSVVPVLSETARQAGGGGGSLTPLKHVAQRTYVTICMKVKEMALSILQTLHDDDSSTLQYTKVHS